MGGKQSRCSCRHHSCNQNHRPNNSFRYEPPSSRFQSFPASYRDLERTRKLHSKYQRIGDDYSSLEQVTEALALAGLESSNLIIGFDFTKSNEWMGARSFNRRSLHHLGDCQNPYEQAISIIGRTLSAFDEDNLIPCFGFGDATTHDQDVFSFLPDESPCNGFEDVLRSYREIVPHVQLSGPTSFAPIIETAIGIVDNSGGQYHVLLIIADGQVTRSVDTDNGQLSPQEQSTVDAIVKASGYPLSIVLVGVGDGPWDTMHNFDDNIPARAFDNFQFVNFTEIMTKHIPMAKKEAEFALNALMEIPSQYKATIDLQLLGCQRGIPMQSPLPPPMRKLIEYSHSNQQIAGSHQQKAALHDAPFFGERSSKNTICHICRWNKKDCAFGCGHQTCFECGQTLIYCPMCQNYIATKIKLYD